MSSDSQSLPGMGIHPIFQKQQLLMEMVDSRRITIFIFFFGHFEIRPDIGVKEQPVFVSPIMKSTGYYQRHTNSNDGSELNRLLFPSQ